MTLASLGAASNRYWRIDDESLEGKMAAKSTAFPRLTCHEQLGVVSRQYVLNNRKSETEATLFSCAAAIDAKEALGQARYVLLSDALTRVGND